MAAVDPSQGAAPAPADTAAPDDSGAEQIVITITAVGDGTFTVSMGGDSDAGEGESGGDEPQTASSIDDACKMAKEMYQAESGEEDAPEPDDSEDGNAPMAPEAAASAWKQMAGKRKSAGM